MSEKCILGMDIGYSNLKLAFGDLNSYETKVLPIGAGPIGLLPLTIMGKNNDEDSLYVYINGEKWVVGVEPNRLQGWERELHADYSSTDSYKALFYASLLLCGKQEIDLLVTGLPVSQSLDPKKKDALAKTLIGTHNITPKVSVNVKNVLVIPQPIGGFLNTVDMFKDDNQFLDVILNGKTVIIDPGFFSVDWVVVESGEVRYKASGTNLKAMSVLIEVVNDLIKNDYGASSGKAKIEEAIRTGNNSLYIQGNKIDISHYIETASEKVPDDALVAMKTSIRDLENNVDTVIITGGGAEVYKKAVEKLFPCSVIISNPPVIANALGFYFFGKQKINNEE